MDKKDILIESAKYIAEHCAEHSECNDSCVFYMENGRHVCLFHTAYTPSGWKINAVEEKLNADFIRSEYCEFYN